MSINEILLKVDLNSKIARKEWPKNKYILIREVRFLTLVIEHNSSIEERKYVPSLNDLIQSDWYIITDTIQ